jgi:hypothetical protein
MPEYGDPSRVVERKSYGEFFCFLLGMISPSAIIRLSIAGADADRLVAEPVRLDTRVSASTGAKRPQIHLPAAFLPDQQQHHQKW